MKVIFLMLGLLFLVSAVEAEPVSVLQAASSSNYRTSTRPEKAIDNNYRSSWIGAVAKDPWWISFDLGAVYNLTQISIWWSSLHGATNYDIRVSMDGNQWSNIYTGLDTSGSFSRLDYDLSGHLAQYLRLYIHSTQRYYPVVPRIYEVKIYGQLGEDTTAPFVAITAPQNNATLSGKVDITAEAHDELGRIDRVEFYIDTLLKYTASSFPYSFQWDSTSSANGIHRIKVLAYDSSANSAWEEIQVRVDNVPESTNITSLGAASSSNYRTSTRPEKAIDNNYRSSWIGEVAKDPWWISFDLGAVYNLTQISIWWSSLHGATNYDIQVSMDGKQWSNIYTGLDTSGSFSRLDYDLSGHLAQYLRLYIHSTQRYYPVVPRIYEVKIYGERSTDLSKAEVWILNQQVPNTIVAQPDSTREGLFLSYQIPEDDPEYEEAHARSWIYDDALGVIALCMGGNFAAAKDALDALRYLQATETPNDGRICFYYDTNTSEREAIYMNGSLAWLGYAILFYQQKSGDTQFEDMAKQIASFLISQQYNEPANPRYGLLKGVPDETWISTEFNIDAYFFLKKLGEVSADPVYIDVANLIKQAMLSQLWDARHGRFYRGFQDGLPTLDANSWGSFFLVDIEEPQKALTALQYVEETFFNTQTIAASSVTLSGYGPYDKDTVWGEGSLGVALAYKKLGDSAQAEKIIAEILKMQAEDGGVPYASHHRFIYGQGFVEFKSMASTAWLVMLQREDNGLFTAALQGPILYPIGDKLVQQNCRLEFKVSAFNPGGEALVYVVHGLPAGASFDTTTGVFSWVPDRNQVGSHQLRFQVSNGSDSFSEDINIVVREAEYSLKWRLGFGTLLSGAQTSDIDADTKWEMAFGNAQGFIHTIEYDAGQYQEDWQSEYLGGDIHDLTLADIDDDGTTEIVAGVKREIGGSFLYVFDGITKEQEWQSQVLSGPNCQVASADIDDNSTVEIVAASGNYIYIFDGISKTEIWRSAYLSNPVTTVTLADLDRDNTVEIIATAGKNIYIFDGISKELKSMVEGLEQDIQAQAVSDIDNDGELEIVVGSGSYIYIFDGETLTEEFKLKLEAVYSLAADDIDNDGICELIAGTAHYLYVLDGETKSQEWKSSWYKSRVSSLCICDIDNNGRQKLIACLADGSIEVLEGSSKQEVHSYFGGQFSTLASADIDKDGLREIVTAKGDDLYVFDAINREEQWSGYCPATVGLALSDIDNDGTVEIIAADDYLVRVLDGVTKRLEWQSPALYPSNLAVEDIDDDGIKEIVIAAMLSISYQRVYVFDGISKEEQGRYQLAGLNSGLALGDVDEDGQKEIVVAALSAEVPRLYVLEGISGEEKWKEDFAAWVEIKGLSLADIDNDGFSEIAAVDYFGTVYILNGITKEQKWSGKLTPFLNMAIADVDYDSNYEIVGLDGNHGSYLYVYDWEAGQRQWQSANLGVLNSQCLEISDVDNDGRNELISAGAYLWVFDTEGTREKQ